MYSVHPNAPTAQDARAHPNNGQGPPISRAEFEAIADRLGLTIPDGDHRRGPNPFTGEGRDGFCIFFPECNGTDRNGDFKKSRREMLERAGAQTAAPTPAAPSGKTFDTRTLEERGLTPEARRFFCISGPLEVEGTWGEKRHFPTFHPDGSEGRHRDKFRDPARQPTTGKDGKPRRQAKNLWDAKTKDKGQPVAYGLNWIEAGDAVYLVNSELAVWLFWQHGLRAICPLGEGRSEASFRAMFRAAKDKGAAQIVFLLDADEQGQSATATALKAARAVGLNATAKRWPEGVKAGYDASDFEEAHRAEDFAAALDSLLDGHHAPTNEPRGREPFRPKISTARELMAREIAPARFIADGLIAEGLTVFAGNPKLGKSWLMLNLGLAVAFGGTWLGSVQVEAGDVLYLALEDNERRMKTRLEKCLQGQEAPANFHYATAWRRVDEGGLDDLREWLKAHPNARLIVVDTLQKVKPRRRNGGNVYEQDSDDLGLLKALADEYAVALICVTHRRKGTDADDLEAITGSFGISGTADGILSLKRERGKSDAVLTATGRDLEEDKELALKFDPILGSWAVLGDADEYRMSSERAAIANAIRDAASPLSPKEIAAATGKKDGTIRFLLFKMAQDGQVVAIGQGRYILPTTANTANTANSTNSANGHASTANSFHAQDAPQNSGLSVEDPANSVSDAVSGTKDTANSDAVSGVSEVSAVSTVSTVSGKSLFTNDPTFEGDEPTANGYGHD
jgi:hypothetical protein